MRKRLLLLALLTLPVTFSSLATNYYTEHIKLFSAGFLTGVVHGGINNCVQHQQHRFNSNNPVIKRAPMVITQGITLAGSVAAGAILTPLISSQEDECRNAFTTFSVGHGTGQFLAESVKVKNGKIGVEFNPLNALNAFLAFGIGKLRYNAHGI